MENNNILSGFFLNSDKRLSDTGILLLRLIMGLVLFVIGAGKVFGWFGGMGLEATIEALGKGGIPPFWAYVSCYTEFLGGFLLLIGLISRLAAIPVFINMLVATITTLPKGFFFGGAAYPCTFMIIALMVLLAGPGIFSIDYLLFRKKIPAAET